jgi:hypothetical protein
MKKAPGTKLGIIMRLLRSLPVISASLAVAFISFDPALAEENNPLGSSPIADTPGSISILGGVSVGNNTLGDVLFPTDLKAKGLGEGGFVGLAMSRQLVRFWGHYWLEAEMGGGFRFEPAVDYYNPEAWAAIYLKFDGFPWNDVIRTSVGVSTGLHWIAELTPGDTNYGQYTIPENAVLQHYFSPEIAFSLPDRPQDELFVRIHHRSTGYGLFWNTEAGSNVVAIGLRFRR